MTESVNTAMLDELKMLMEDDFSILLETYIQDSDDRLQALDSAISSANSTEVRELAHSFKGSSANLGAQPLADICLTLETMGREGTLEGAESAYDDLKKEYEQVRTYFNSQL